MRAEHQARYARGKRQGDGTTLPVDQPDEFRLQRRGDGQQTGKRSGQDQSDKENDGALQTEYQPAGLDEAAVVPAIPVVLVVNQQARCRGGHAGVNEAHISHQGAHDHPQPKPLGVQVMQRHGHGGERIDGGGRQQGIAGKHPMNGTAKAGHKSLAAHLFSPQPQACARIFNAQGKV